MLFSPIPDDFICGVVEGFYGRPWTLEQRRSLFSLIKQFGLNTYLYAPKDDVKHRACWRERYTADEGKHLAELIAAANSAGVRFVYAISPGLDVQISARVKVKLLKEKLSQVLSFGCHAFALLFDDIYLDLCQADREEFAGSAAAVQAYIANEIYQFLNQPPVFLFCPTEYCTSRAVPDVLNSEYLQTLGHQLHPSIDILWTGPMVVSKFITPQFLADLHQVIRRRPVIWDNIHANDYDQKCLYMGPYDGRTSDLCDHIRGVLTNPNCEFEANFIAFHTLAQWVTVSYLPGIESRLAATGRCFAPGLVVASEGEDMDERNPDETITPDDFEAGESQPHSSTIAIRSIQLKPRVYDPRLAYICAIADWLEGAFYLPKPSPNFSVFPKPSTFLPPPASEAGGSTFGSDAGMSDSGATLGHIVPFVDSSPVNTFNNNVKIFDESSNHSTEAMDFTNAGVTSSKKTDKGMEKDGDDADNDADRLTVAEVEMVADLFYLPFETGSFGIWLIETFTWLRMNAHLINNRTSRSADIELESKWHSRADELCRRAKLFNVIIEKVCQTANRSLLFDLYPYVSDMRCVIGMLASYVKWLSSSRSFREAFLSGQQEPWMFRGGLTGELQRLLPTEGAGDLVYSIPNQALTERIYMVRPFVPQDESSCYEICRRYFHNITAKLNDASLLHDLVPDVNIGPFLTLSPDYAFVLVEAVTESVVGYCFATLEAKQFYERCANAYYIDLGNKYPSEILQKVEDESIIPVATEVLNTIHSYDPPIDAEALFSRYPSLSLIHYDKDQVENPVVLRQLVAVSLAALKANGSLGVHTLMYPWNNVEYIEEHETMISLLGFQRLSGSHFVPDRKKESHTIYGRKL